MRSDTSGGALGTPPFVPVTPDLVDLPRWWLVPGQPDATFAFIKSHPPTGSKLSMIGYSGKPPSVTVRDVGFQWPPQRGVLDTRILVVYETAAPNGGTAVRADAQVVWVLPRPASEQIPSSVRVLTVSVKRPGKRAASITVSKRRIVRRLAAVINGLETVQPGLTACPNIRPDTVAKVSFSFRPRPTAPPLAVARERFFAQAPAGDPCDPIAFTTNGHPQRPLLDPMGITIRTAARLLGKLP